MKSFEKLLPNNKAWSESKIKDDPEFFKQHRPEIDAIQSETGRISHMAELNIIGQMRVIIHTPNYPECLASPPIPRDSQLGLWFGRWLAAPDCSLSR